MEKLDKVLGLDNNVQNANFYRLLCRISKAKKNSSIDDGFEEVKEAFEIAKKKKVSKKKYKKPAMVKDWFCSVLKVIKDEETLKNALTFAENTLLDGQHVKDIVSDDWEVFKNNQSIVTTSVSMTPQTTLITTNPEEDSNSDTDSDDSDGDDDVPEVRRNPPRAARPKPKAKKAKATAKRTRAIKKLGIKLKPLKVNNDDKVIYETIMECEYASTVTFDDIHGLDQAVMDFKDSAFIRMYHPALIDNENEAYLLYGRKFESLFYFDLSTNITI